ncbi:hypothetical protein V2J09_022606 [Rumex salicifolius]
MKLKIWNGKVFESERGVVAGDNVDGDSRNVVVVGVKLEQHSRELLTWALMKVAQPGDRVVALHVMHASSEEQSSLVSLIKTFDSVLAVYEGFCHLKQVDLKLKVLQGSSVRKILIQEAKSYGAATLVVGTSKAHYPILSPTSVAKHCARKLSHNFSVFAVNNGKIVFGRKASACNSVVYKLSYYSKVASGQNDLALTPVSAVIKEAGSDPQSKFRSHKHFSGPKRPTLIKRYFSCAPNSSWADYASDLQAQPCIDVSLNSSLALVPYQTPETSSKQNCETDQEVHEHKQGWALIRRVFLPKVQHSDKASTRNSIIRCFSRWRTQNSAITIHSDVTNIESSQDTQPPDGGGENGAIVPVVPYTSSPPCSPVHGPDAFAEELKSFHSKYSSVCRLFTYQELLSATYGFQPERIIGKGGSSRVFRGQLSDGKELAVKILKPSESVLKEFIAEIEIVTSISHKNIVSLFGFCIENGSPILVYDLLPRGSLEENLLGYKKDPTAFCWEKRYKVALGVAEALDYLHNESSLPVIHRDVKSSNILLAEDFEPQLADFGLATRSSSASSFTKCTDVAGTFGYMAPEYFMHGKVTEMIDVYAFGVVLLELLSGRKPIDDNNPKGQESLVIWATPILKDGKILDLLDDASLGMDYDNDLVERMGLAAALCLKREPLLRPRSNIIVRLLHGDSDVTKWARQQVNCSSADFDDMEEETSPKDIQSHLNLAFLDLEDDALSVGSTEPNVSLEDYLKGRCSRWPSFD